jgi:hypothetical protein
MGSKSNRFVVHCEAIEKLERLVNEHSVDFAKMSELVLIIKEKYLELTASHRELIESNAALVQTVVDLGGPTGSCCVSQ